MTDHVSRLQKLKRRAKDIRDKQHAMKIIESFPPIMQDEAKEHLKGVLDEGTETLADEEVLVQADSERLPEKEAARQGLLTDP